MRQAGGRTNGAKRTISEAQAQWVDHLSNGVPAAKRVTGPTPNPTGSYSGGDIPRDVRTIETTSPPSFPAVRGSASLKTPNFELKEGDVAFVRRDQAVGVAKQGGVRIQGSIAGTLFRDSPPVDGFNIQSINKDAAELQLKELSDMGVVVEHGIMPRELLAFGFIEKLAERYSCVGTLVKESSRSGGDSHVSSFTGNTKSSFGLLPFDRTKLCALNFKGWDRIRNHWSRWIPEGTGLWFRWQPATIVSGTKYTIGYVPNGRGSNQNTVHPMRVGTAEGVEVTLWQLVPYVLPNTHRPKCQDVKVRVKTTYKRNGATATVDVTVKTHGLIHIGFTRVSLVEQLSHVSATRVAYDYQYLCAVDGNDRGAVEMVGAFDSTVFVK